MACRPGRRNGNGTGPARMKVTELVPWLVRSHASFWGEFLFVEVRTDEGITGWGEITSTTKTANRAVAAVVRQLNDLLVGADPAAIELTWHKVFRAFTYTGSKGAASNVTSAVDIALWDIRGKVLGVPVAELLGGPVRPDLLLYTHPDQSRFGTADGVAEEIRRIVDSGHTAIKFDPFPHSDDVPEANDRYLDGRLSRADERRAVELTAQIRDAAGPDIELLVDTPTADSTSPPPSGSRRTSMRPPTCTGSRSLCRRRATTPCGRCGTGFGCPSRSESGCTPGGTSCPSWRTSSPTSSCRTSPGRVASASSRRSRRWPRPTTHDASGPINLVAGAHVMSTTPNFYRLESSSYDLQAYNELIQVPLENPGGRLRLPSGPGLGIDFDLEYLRGNVLDGFGG